MTDVQSIVSGTVTLGDATPVSLDFSDFSVTRNSDTLSGDYSVTVAGPMPEYLNPLPVYVDGLMTDTGTPVAISLEVNGESFDLATDARIKTASENVNAETVVSSTISGYLDPDTEKLKLSPEKDLYFIAVEWLNEKWGSGGWKLSDGQLMTSNLSARGVYGVGTQLVDPSLPAKEEDSANYTLRLSAPTYWQIGQYLCNEMGFVFRTNVPNFKVLKVRKIERTKSYWQAIQDLFGFLNPEYKIIKKDGVIYLYVLDICGTSSTIQQTGSLLLPPSFLLVKNYIENSRARDTKLIDHVIIKGSTRKIPNTVIKTSGNTLSSVRLNTISLSEDQQQSWVSHYEDGFNIKKMDDYTKGFGSTPTQIRTPKSVACINYYHVDDTDQSKWILLREERTTYDKMNEVLSYVSIEHKYAEGYKLVQTVEREYGWCQWPGQPFERFVNHQNRIILQDEIVADINQASKVEILEGLILVTRMTNVQTGKEYYDGATNLVEATKNNAVDSTARTRQKVIEMTTKTKHSTINRVTPQVLRQMEIEYDRVANTTDVRSDIIANPFKSQSSSTENQYSKDFYNGVGPYQPAFTIECPDINNDKDAYMVAQRIFARNDKDRKPEATITVECVLPLPLLATDMTVTLDDIPYLELVGNAYLERIVTGGTYVIKKIVTKLSDKGPTQTLDLSLVI